MKRSSAALGVIATYAAISMPAIAQAHIAVASGVGVANTTQEIVFGVGHGCAGADTYQVKIDIPAGVTSVRPVPSDFGAVSVQKDAAGTITAVVWKKADSDVLPADIAYYKLTLRAKLPNAPFSTVYFPAHQSCRAADQSMTTVDWVALPTDPVVDGGEAEPAPALTLVPARQPGWNKVTVPIALSNLSNAFADATIVWRGTAAYSPNPTTTELIAATPGVTPLSSLAPNDVIWVKY